MLGRCERALTVILKTIHRGHDHEKTYREQIGRNQGPGQAQKRLPLRQGRAHRQGQKAVVCVMAELSKGRQQQLAAAFRAGRAARKRAILPFVFLVGNVYSRGGVMPESGTVAFALWHAFEAGKYREDGQIKGSATMMRNARLCMKKVKR